MGQRLEGVVDDLIHLRIDVTDSDQGAVEVQGTLPPPDRPGDSPPRWSRAHSPVWDACPLG